jgi:hypothetical protein
MSDEHDTLENKINYWSASSAKTNHHSVLSSQREDPPFLVQYPKNRPVPGTKAVPTAMRESPISLPLTDEPELPKIDKMDIPSDESQNEVDDHSKITKGDVEHPTDQDKPKRKLARSKTSSNPAAAQAPGNSVRTRSAAKRLAQTESTSDQASISSSVVIVNQSDNEEGEDSTIIALMVRS